MCLLQPALPNIKKKEDILRYVRLNPDGTKVDDFLDSYDGIDADIKVRYFFICEAFTVANTVIVLQPGSKL